MTQDHIVEEIRRIREDQAAKFQFDIRKLLAAARKRQRKSPHKVVSFAAKKNATA